MTITSKNFTKTVTSILSAYGKLSDKIQDVLIFALNHYCETGNTVFVQKLLRSNVNIYDHINMYV